MKQNHSSSFPFISNNIIFITLAPAGKKGAYQKASFVCFYEKTRVSCYKLCEENKSIKVQMLALRK